MNKKIKYLFLVAFIFLFTINCGNNYQKIYPSYYKSKVFEEKISETSKFSTEKNKEKFHELTLENAIQRALTNNPNIAVAVNVIEEIDAQKETIKENYWPKLTTNIALTEYLKEQRTLSNAVSNHIVSGDLILKMSLFNGAKDENEIESANYLKESAQFDLKRKKQELIFNVTVIFYTLLYQQKVIESLIFYKESLQKNILFTEELIKAKKAVENDKLKTELALAETEQKIEQENNIFSIQKRTLLNLMGVKSNNSDISLSGELILKKDNELPQKEKVINSILSNRSDYLSLQSKLKAQAKTIDSIDSGFLPLVSLYGSYGGVLAIAPSKNPSNDIIEDKGQIGLMFEFSILDSLFSTAKIKKEKAKINQIEQQLNSMKLNINSEVEKAFINLSSFNSRIIVSEKTISLAQKNIENEQEKYKLGITTLLEVLNAQLSLLNAKLGYYNLIANYNISEAELKLIAGEN